MKKITILIAGLFGMLFVGCMNTSHEKINYAADGKTAVSKESDTRTMPTTGKQVRLKYECYALKASFYDTTTGNFSPYLDLGIFTMNYFSSPMAAGQPYFVQNKTYSNSWWNWISFFKDSDTKTNLVQEDVIWVGVAPEGSDSALAVTDMSGVGLMVNKNGFTLPGVKVEVKMQTTGK